jgi:hypothetical protein
MGRTPWKRHFLAICAALVLTVKVVLILLLLLSKAKRRALKGECISFIFLCFLLWKRKEYFAAAFCYSNSESFPREGRRNHQSITRRQDISTPERECTGGKELRCCHWWEGEQCETSPRPPGSWGVSACYSGVEFLAGRSGRCLTYRAGAPMVTALRYGQRGGGGGALHRRRLRLARLLAINGLCTGAARLERD